MKSRIFSFLTSIMLLVGLCSVSAQTIKGRLASPDGKALVAASIVVKGTPKGAVTNRDGEFILKVPSMKEPVLIFVLKGYTQLEYKAKVHKDSVYTLRVVLAKENVTTQRVGVEVVSIEHTP